MKNGRVITMERELLIAGFGGAFSYRLGGEPSRFHSLLARLDRAIRAALRACKSRLERHGRWQAARSCMRR
jgi:hypothetical protein